MNTKTDGISSGLVAVAWIAPDEDRFRVRICEDRPTDAPLWSPMCWVSDAEAIIAQKDAEIIEQCRINGMGAERELALLGQIERQSAALKLARQVLMSVKETSSSTRLRRIVNDPIAAINEVLGE